MPARVLFTRAARADLVEIFEWLVRRAGPDRAFAYIGRIEQHCRGLLPFPQRGTARSDIRPGLRLVGFERRATIAFTVVDEDVIVLRVLYGGRSVERAFGQDPE